MRRFALRDISLLHTNETYVLIPHFISRRAISSVKHSRLPRRFHRDEKIARMHTERRNNSELVLRFNPFHLSRLKQRQREREREHPETLIVIRRTFLIGWGWRVRSVLLTCPFPCPFCKSIKYHDKNKHGRTKGGDPSLSGRRNLAWFTRFSRTDFRECPNYLSRVPRS